jgi:hypothetical protein
VNELEAALTAAVGEWAKGKGLPEPESWAKGNGWFMFWYGGGLSVMYSYGGWRGFERGETGATSLIGSLRGAIHWLKARGVGGEQ